MAKESNTRQTKSERRGEAREKARLAREQEKKREKRNRLLIQGSIVLVVLVAIAGIGFAVVKANEPEGPGPRNMASGGMIFGEDLKVVETPALESGEARTAPEVDRGALPVDVTIYVDYMCPGCGNFEQTYGSMLENYTGSGDITLQVYPVNFEDGQSLGTKYSTRAANTVACAVDQQPDVAFDLHNRLLSANVQPSQGTQGLTDEALIEQAEAAGVTADDNFTSCVNDQRFGDFISGNYKAATDPETGVLGLAEGAQLNAGGQLQPAGEPQVLTGTPLVIVNGEEWISTRDGELEAFLLKKKAEIEENGAGEPAAEDAEGAADEPAEEQSAE
ncbi:MAG: DsbA family protein [Leucobacter sp.]